jgi:hypothetical protein
MSGKTGKKPTGRKPMTARRQSAKSDGAFGKEDLNRVTSGESTRNTDKGARSRRGTA